MPIPKVYVTRSLPENGMKLIKKQFSTEVWPKDVAPPKEVLIEKAANVDVLVSLLSDEIDEEVFEAAPNLKIVAQYAVGFDNIALQEAVKRGIYVTNTPGVLTETTADFAMALLLAVARRVVEANDRVKSGRWNVGWHPKMLLGRDVYGSTLGIIGLGRIGSAVARRAQGFDMEILYYTPTRKEHLEKELRVAYAQLERLLQRSDFVSVHVPLKEETFHLIDEEKLKQMKSTAILINNSRGPVIDERALYKALKNGWIAGAGLDVFEREPTPQTNPLLTLDNVVVAPHISSASYETRSKMSNMVAENLIAFSEGRIPPNLVNDEVTKVREPGF
ncbi:MAG: D-glycerate dehydrogenase [Candidatus Korarchaeota archaeon]|nr:D-glycerate dehydrogenase [Candidatus Korarchaeota archaeon]NIU81914.1 D-glycerate dehydrogenase [Candidatus Thorarchaeota archaeon]NIW12372.1 D-glycerate dehydrogenase [Candidatus Thorarchaeota archaeon]NIW51164.1 D-glycerate dehydrogenase [Candidatus Korarchaeota archaeon]